MFAVQDPRIQKIAMIQGDEMQVTVRATVIMYLPHESNGRTYDTGAGADRGGFGGSAGHAYGNRRRGERFAGPGRGAGADGGADQAAHRLRDFRGTDVRGRWILPQTPFFDWVSTGTGGQFARSGGAGNHRNGGSLGAFGAGGRHADRSPVHQRY